MLTGWGAPLRPPTNSFMNDGVAAMINGFVPQWIWRAVAFLIAALVAACLWVVVGCAVTDVLSPKADTIGSLTQEVSALRAELALAVEARLVVAGVGDAVGGDQAGFTTGDDSSVFVYQAAGGGSGLLAAWSMLVWWYGRRTPLRVGRRLVTFIGKAVKPEHREGVRQIVCTHNPDIRSSRCTCDPAEHWINREVKRGKKGKT